MWMPRKKQTDRNREIRKKHSEGISQTVLSREYNLSAPRIHQIIHSAKQRAAVDAYNQKRIEEEDIKVLGDV